jgi:tetratricopeptide (TPR) repeat protein
MRKSLRSPAEIAGGPELQMQKAAEKRMSRGSTIFGGGSRPIAKAAAAVLSIMLLQLVAPVAGQARPAIAEIGGLPANIERLYNSGHYQEAAEALTAAAEAKPKEPALPYWLGRCFYEMRDFARSVSSFEHAVALDAERSEFHDWLGRAWGRKAEESGTLAAFSALSMARKASHEFATAVRLDAGNLEAQRDLIRYLLNAPGIAGGSEERAQEQINALAAIDPIEGRLARAELFTTHKKFDQADEEYQKILHLPLRRESVALEIAEYYRDKEDGEHMQEAVNIAAELDPADRRLQYYRGVVLILTHRNAAEAEKNLRAYMDSVPNSAEVPPHASAHEWLARLYEGEQKLDLAAQEYEAALTLDPHNKGIREALKRVQKK